MRIVRMGGRWIEDFPASPWRWLALPAAILYATAVGTRNAAFDLGLRRPRRLAVPVLSIGNLTAGGTGKTPVTRLVAELCREHGAHPAVLSRGYRHAGGTDRANDEAQLMGDIPVHCDPERHAAGLRAISAGADCLLLDDGFQHRQLHRDLDIVLIDATRPWGWVLPAGYQRESRSGLARASLLWLTRSDLVPEDEAARILTALGRVGAPVVRDHAAPVRLAEVVSGAPRLVESLRDGTVVLVSGLGNPSAFEIASARLGWRIAASLRYPDHHRYDRSDLAVIRGYAAEAGAQVVMTAKDAVKIAPLAAAHPGTEMLVLHGGHELPPADRQTLAALVAASLRQRP
ncbi:MAG: tetraacyldisaccharide 4'-kinase [Planctomycetes bacterium]|nr:tetraacyldisaccharide 4'-kinase [Planctomycetota bacterium]